MEWEGRLALALLVAALAALALGACGGGDSSSTTAAEAGSGGSSSGQSGGGEAVNSPGSFLVPGGDNSVQTFGEEASPAERRAASAVLEAYMRARAEGDWPAACAALEESAIEPLEKTVGSGGKGASCPATLAALARGTPASTRINTMRGPIGSLRIEGDRAFALYHGIEGIDFVVQMSKQGVAWEVAALAPFELS